MPPNFYNCTTETQYIVYFTIFSFLLLYNYFYNYVNIIFFIYYLCQTFLSFQTVKNAGEKATYDLIGSILRGYDPRLSTDNLL